MEIFVVLIHPARDLEIFETEIWAFEQIISKLSFLSFSLAELEVFSFPSSSTEFSAA